MTRTRKHPPGLGDRTLDTLWHDAVLAHYGHRCIICGGGGTLEAHHCVKRRYTLLRYDLKNGVPVHRGDCHAKADRMGIYAAPTEHQYYLLGMAQVTFKQHLQEFGMSNAEFRGRARAALMAELARGGEA